MVRGRPPASQFSKREMVVEPLFVNYALKKAMSLLLAQRNGPRLNTPSTVQFDKIHPFKISFLCHES